MSDVNDHTTPRIWTVTLEDQGVPHDDDERRRSPFSVTKQSDRTAYRPMVKAVLDYTQTCHFQKRGSHQRIARCDDFVLSGSRYCPKHNRQMTE